MILAALWKKDTKGQSESYSGYICSHASGFISGGGSVFVLQIWKIALKYSNKMIEYR